MTSSNRDSDTTDRLLRLLDAVDDAIVLLDDGGRIELWPESAQRLFGHEAADVEGTLAAMLFVTPPPLTALEGNRFSAEGWHIRKDGSRFWGEAVLRPMGSKRGSALTIHDLSSRRAADEAALAHTIDLERSNRELDEFAALASHDLQEPVRKIRAFAERLRTRLGASLDETSADYMNRMEASATRMQRLLEDLLEYSRLATRQDRFERVSLGDIASQALADLESLVEKQEAVIEVEALPTVEGSATQLRRLFQNLIANALKFHAPDQPPMLRITSRSVPPAAGRPRVWAISFEDKGIGFDEKHVERIFGMFQRLHGRMAYEGTGMGLAICRRIAVRHGGGITARSTPGKGATFIVTLPEMSTTKGATS